jgi:hypothetical protein
MRHVPWDDGALALGRAILGQQSIKTQCGRRVAYLPEAVQENPRDRVECSACAESLAGFADATRAIGAYIAAMEAR